MPRKGGEKKHPDRDLMPLESWAGSQAGHLNSQEVREVAEKMREIGLFVTVSFPCSCNICRLEGRAPRNYATLEDFLDHVEVAHAA